ncbi:MAG: carboxypeptidase regulatory-like domain-containing protein [Thermoanaerobaculum sp.]
MRFGRGLGLLLAVTAPADTLLWDSGGTSLVVSVEVGGREVAVVEALASDEGVCLPVGEFARFSGAAWDGPSRTLSTPLGEVRFQAGELLASGEDLYLCPKLASARLGVVMAFDPAAVTVRVDLPWQLPQPAVYRRPHLVPEVRAPGWGLGTLRADAWLLREGSSTRWSTTAQVTGRAFSGQWRLLLDSPQGEDPAVRELLWVRRWERQALLLGRTFQQISPLFSGLDVVGVQWVASNEPLPRLAGGWGGLLAGVSALRTFRGPAPVGSVVRLRLDGVVVGSQTVGVSGRYEFVDVPVSGRGVVVAEVEIYDRHNLLVPVEVRRELASTASFLLPPGRRVHTLGFGSGGSFGRKLLGEGQEGKPTVFYSLRWGLSPRTSLEVLGQARGGREQLGLGVATTPLPWIAAFAEVAEGSGAGAYLLEGALYRQSFEVLGRFLAQGEGFGLLSDLSPRRKDRSVELRRFFGSWLELGAWARDWQEGGRKARWVRPTFALSLGNWFFARAFPDQEGDTVGFASASPHPRLRLSGAFAKTQSFDLQWELPGSRSPVLRGTWETGGKASDRVTVTVGNRPSFWGALAFRLGGVKSGGHTGAYLEASLRVAGGFFLRAEYVGVPTRATGKNDVRPRLSLSLTADYAYASGLFTPTGGLGVQRETGAIAGRLVVLGGSSNLAGARVVVHGFGGAVTDAAGRFFLASVPPGVYEVELDPEKLPLELSPLRSRTVVEVAAGVTTRVDFPLQLLLGFAGRVLDREGKAVSGVRVEVVDGGGRELAATTTDPFGLYRFDQLPAGTYTVRVVDPSGKPLASRKVELSQFLFDQDVQLPILF